ncbi:hypothetical protein RUND412_009950 [Rhizina undulata]
MRVVEILAKIVDYFHKIEQFNFNGQRSLPDPSSGVRRVSPILSALAALAKPTVPAPSIALSIPSKPTDKYFSFPSANMLAQLCQKNEAQLFAAVGQFEESAKIFQNEMATHKKVQWALYGKQRLTKILDDLEKYNDGLSEITKEVAMEQSISIANTIPTSFKEFTTQHKFMGTLQQRRLPITTESACKIVEQLVSHYKRKWRPSPDFQEILNILDLPINPSGRLSNNAADLALTVVHTWLSAGENQGWLLLVDNNDKDNESELDRLIPTCNWGSVIITTRLPNLQRFGECVEVKEIGAEEGIELLLKSSGSIHQKLAESELGEAQTIVSALGELPLALNQAGAYKKLKEGINALFRKGLRDHSLSAQKDSVLTTSEPSFQELTDDARHLLHICAFLSNEDIPEELFRLGKRAIDWMMEDAVTLVASVIVLDRSEKSTDGLIFERRILSYLNVCHANILEYSTESDGTLKAATGLFAIAIAFRHHGFYKQAEESYRSALVVHEKALWKDHPSTLTTVHNMAMVFKNQGRYQEALEFYQRALAGEEKALGKDHPETLATVNNMASVFNDQGRYEEALEFYQRALAGKEKALGKDHPETLDTVNNMALVFRNQGRYKEALEFYQRALARKLKEKALGKDHPSTLTTVRNMALVFRNHRRYEEALEFYQRTLALGKDHPDTLTTVHAMASVFDNQGRLDEALNMFEKALAGREKALGKEHPSTLRTVRSIVRIFNKQGRHEEAMQLKQKYKL